MTKRVEQFVFFGIIALYFVLVFGGIFGASSVICLPKSDNSINAQDGIDNAFVEHEGIAWRIKSSTSGANKPAFKQNLKSLYISDGFTQKESTVAQQFIKNSRCFFLNYAKTDIEFPFSTFT